MGAGIGYGIFLAANGMPIRTLGSLTGADDRDLAARHAELLAARHTAAANDAAAAAAKGGGVPAPVATDPDVTLEADLREWARAAAAVAGRHAREDPAGGGGEPAAALFRAMDAVVGDRLGGSARGPPLPTR